ncbi:hypothetical protein WMW72_23770 [Paenibacillus filicis]|uniref:LPS export ABC transporter periplasmic protein LptC n=1 Tax=Paenibacillus filicis TaxID=669464 RepID=A0ABU9DPZ7_9BACL
MSMRTMGWISGTLAIGISGACWGLGGAVPRLPAIGPPAVAQAADSEAGVAGFSRLDAAAAGTHIVTAAELPPQASEQAGSGAADSQRQDKNPGWTKEETLPLERINGLAVTDDLKTIYELKGEPLAEERDPLFPDERTLVYEDCRVALYKLSVQSVMVTADAGTITIDGKTIPLNADRLKAELGKPDLVAEDGIVYKRQWQALKLYIDPEQGRLLSVHLFPSYTG